MGLQSERVTLNANEALPTKEITFPATDQEKTQILKNVLSCL